MKAKRDNVSVGRVSQVSWWTRMIRWTVRLGLTLIVVVLALIAAWRVFPPISTLMLGRQALLRPVDRQWKPLESLSPSLSSAVLMSEDGQFCRHHGVDWTALESVLDRAGHGGPSRGASTIAMQTAKNLFLWPQRSFVRKGLEITLALAIDAAWPKRRVLEVYLNIAEWGDGVFGAEAAARRYFGKGAAELTRREAALLASALPNPFLRNPARPTRKQAFIARLIERRMQEADVWLDCLK